jgi:hypothetical protein
MDLNNVVRVTPDNWVDVVNRINWRQPETVDRSGNRILTDVNGMTAYQIPFDVWYEKKAYNKMWRKHSGHASN